MKQQHCLIMTLLFLIVVASTAQASSEDVEYTYYYGLKPYYQQPLEHYGTLPVLETEDQRADWDVTLKELSNTIKDDFTVQYMYPYADAVTFGSNSDGYFVVLFRNGTDDKQLMNGIYTYIDAAAADSGIQDVPVEFGYGDYGDKVMEDTSVILDEPEAQVLAEYVKSGRDIRAGTGVVPVLAIYGELPLMKDQEERDRWYETMRLIQYNTRDQVFQAGDVSHFGALFSGRIEVAISKKVPLQEKMVLINDIYEILDEEARKVNVTNVPVTFIEDDFETSIGEAEEVIIPENETSDQPVTNAPGFSALTLLIVISIIWMFRTK